MRWMEFKLKPHSTCYSTHVDVCRKFRYDKIYISMVIWQFGNEWWLLIAQKDFEFSFLDVYNQLIHYKNNLYFSGTSSDGKSVIINHLKLIYIANRSEKKSTAQFPLEKDQKVSFVY